MVQGSEKTIGLEHDKMNLNLDIPINSNTQILQHPDACADTYRDTAKLQTRLRVLLD